MRYMYDGNERDGVIANRENSPNAAKKKVPDGVTLTRVVVSAGRAGSKYQIQSHARMSVSCQTK